MVCPCTLDGVCVVCPGTSELVGQQFLREIKMWIANGGNITEIGNRDGWDVMCIVVVVIGRNGDNVLYWDTIRSEPSMLIVNVPLFISSETLFRSSVKLKPCSICHRVNLKQADQGRR